MCNPSYPSIRRESMEVRRLCVLTMTLASADIWPLSTRGRGHGATSITSAPPGRGHGGSSSFPSSAINSAAAEPRARSLDNRPTTVKVSGLPEGAGEGDLRVHANMAGVVVGAAMLDRPGEGVVKFAERW